MNAIIPTTWSRYVPSPTMPWNLRRVHHLHLRASFAADWATLQKDLADGPDAAVARLLSGSASSVAEFESLEPMIGDAAVGSGDINRLKAWWFYRILYSGDPLTERLVLMWHNHFATANDKVQNVAMMKHQNDVMRQHARSRFSELLRGVIMDAAMMKWLDADSNRKGHPNENLARELMELFTLGEGNYSESDVQEVARALTGWTIKNRQFAFVERDHDPGTKRILGQQGEFDGEAVLEIMLRQKATANRIAMRLCRMFFGESGVSERQREELANGLREHDLDIGWAVETILRSAGVFCRFKHWQQGDEPGAVDCRTDSPVAMSFTTTEYAIVGGVVKSHGARFA